MPQELIIYDALFDPILETVNIWVDLSAIPGQNEFRCVTEYAGRTSSENVTLQEVMRHLDWSVNPWVTFVMTCNAAHLPERLTLQPVGREVVVKEVQTNKRGRLAACLGVIYSHQPLLPNWFTYYSDLGVEHFHVYRARDHSLDQTAISGHDILFTRPFAPHVHPQATYHDVRPGKHRWQYGQATVHSLCIYSLRYTYDYIVLVDTDEYLWFEKPNASLVAFLDRSLPPAVASARFANWYFPACFSNNTSVVDQYTTADGQPELHDSAGKCVVRPLGVKNFYVHKVYEPATGFEEAYNVPVEQAFVKHFRNNCKMPQTSLLSVRMKSQHHMAAEDSPP